MCFSNVNFPCRCPYFLLVGRWGSGWWTAQTCSLASRLRQRTARKARYRSSESRRIYQNLIIYISFTFHLLIFIVLYIFKATNCHAFHLFLDGRLLGPTGYAHQRQFRAATPRFAHPLPGLSMPWNVDVFQVFQMHGQGHDYIIYIIYMYIYIYI